MIEEVKGIEPDPGRDLRARRQRQDDARQNQRNDRRQLQAVDRPPPVAEGVSLFTGEHGCSHKRETRPLVADDGFQGVNGVEMFASSSRSFVLDPDVSYTLIALVNRIPSRNESNPDRLLSTPLGKNILCTADTKKRG